MSGWVLPIAWMTGWGIAAAEPVVAVGDDLVLAAAEPGPGAAGGWVQVLGDCLDERSPGRFAVSDRGLGGAPARSLAERVPELKDLGRGGVVVLGVGARELLGGTSPEQWSAELGAVVGALREAGGPRVVLIDLIAPEALPEDQARLDLLADTAASELRKLALANGVEHVALWKDWPREGRGRKVLLERARSLSARGHARVAGAICDLLAPEERPSAPEERAAP